MPTLTDNFDRPDSLLNGGSWTADTCFDIVSGEVICDSSGNAFAWVTATETATDQHISIDVKVNGGNDGTVIARGASFGGDSYRLTLWGNDGWYVELYQGGGWQGLLGSYNAAPDIVSDVWHAVEWIITGNDHIVLINGNAAMAFTDTTLTSGFAGFMSGHETTLFDNFSVTYEAAELPSNYVTLHGARPVGAYYDENNCVIGWAVLVKDVTP